MTLTVGAARQRGGSLRWVKAIKWVGGASVAALVLAVTPAIEAADSDGPQGRTVFYASGITVTTSTGRHVLFYLQTGERDTSLDIFGSRTSGGGTETHDWTFYAPHHVFATYHRSSGSGRIDATLSNLDHFGAVHLAFRQTGPWTTTACDAGSTSSAPLEFSGTFYFRTKSSGRHPWGHAGTASHPVSFNTKGRAVRFN